MWLRKECGRLLSEVIVRPKGVQSVLRGMLDAPGSGQGKYPMIIPFLSDKI